MTSENTNDDISLFYEISEFDRQSIIKSCHAVGRTEEEFIKDYQNTAKYAWQSFYYYLFQLFTLKEFQRLMVIYVIGLILILIFVK